jgi:hypothetical protein
LPDDFEEKTSSSMATALAAGLAALILYRVRLEAIRQSYNATGHLVLDGGKDWRI